MIKSILADLLTVKQSLSRINGTITKLAELAFIDFLRERCIISDEEVQQLTGHSLEVSAFANGYDVYIPEKKIVAEIKALIPYEGLRFGGAQIQSLEKDVDGLIDPSKKKKAQVNSTECIKFLVLLSSQDETSFSSAVKGLVRHLSNKGFFVTDSLPEDNKLLNTNTIYIVTIPLY
ncbi:MAG: hypothetical protein K2M76_05410 [Muribaculaceae bacterium]|nr:hypothetical protein [Muribaculaceae bacterium]